MLNGNTVAATFVLVAQGNGLAQEGLGEYAVILAALVIVANFSWMVLKAMKEQKSGRSHAERLAALEARMDHAGDNVENLYEKIEKLGDKIERKV